MVKKEVQEQSRLDTVVYAGGVLDEKTLEVVYPSGKRIAIERYFRE